MVIKDRVVFSQTEYSVLKCLKSKKKLSQTPSSEVGEISSHLGIRDSEEVLRALYTLEGKNLVEPHPRGDFTSNIWQITEIGVKALDMLDTDAR